MKEVAQQLGRAANIFRFLTVVFVGWLCMECRREKAEVPIRYSEGETDGRSKQIELMDSMNLAALELALRDKNSIESFAMIRFLHDTFPRRLFQLTALRDLTISFTYVDTLPNEICKMQLLEVLALNKNKLSDISHVTCLDILKRLELRNNRLTSLPVDFVRLNTLEYLNLANNDFAHGFGAQLPRNLKEVYLSGCSMEEFPSDLLRLESIEIIDVSGNPELRTLPRDIVGLVHLKVLNLKGTGVSARNIEEIRKVMKECSIYY